MPRGIVAMARSGGHCPLRVSGGTLCSERGQSRDAFQAIRLEETSPRRNNALYAVAEGWLLICLVFISNSHPTLMKVIHKHFKLRIRNDTSYEIYR